MPVVVIDPLTLFRRGLALLLRQWHPGVSVFDVGDIGQALVETDRGAGPQLILVDADLAARRNFTGLRQLIALDPSRPVVLLANALDRNTARAALDLGARGYLPKTASEDVLRHVLARVLSGATFLPHEVAGVGEPLAAEDGAGTMPPGSLLHKLTQRQREVLRHLARGSSNKEIARRLGLLESTVKVHVKTILKKLAAANRTEAARFALEMGLPTDLNG